LAGPANAAKLAVTTAAPTTALPIFVAVAFKPPKGDLTGLTVTSTKSWSVVVTITFCTVCICVAELPGTAFDTRSPTFTSSIGLLVPSAINTAVLPVKL
jgi:hypothetical protein